MKRHDQMDPLVYCPSCNTLSDWAAGGMPWDCSTCAGYGNGILPLSVLKKKRVGCDDYECEPALDVHGHFIDARVVHPEWYPEPESSGMPRPLAARLRRDGDWEAYAMILAALAVIALMAFGLR